MNNCYCKPNCISLAVLTSIVIGIIAGFLTVLGILTLPTAVLWAFFAIAVLSLEAILILSAFAGVRTLRCICNVIRLVLTAITGTILTAILLLVIDVATASIFGGIITGLLFLFFSLLITATACLIRCITDCED